MAQTKDLHASKLFDVKGYVCVVTGGGKLPLTREENSINIHI